MYHVVQNNLFNEFGFRTLLEALEENGCPYTLVDIIPFVHELQPDINPEGNVMVWGATTLGHIAVEKGWKPGRFQNDNFDMRVLLDSPQGYGYRHMLNADAVFTTFECMEFDKPMFCRPVHDSKTFTGCVVRPEELKEWKERVLDISDGFTTLRPDTWVMFSSPKNITMEARFFVVGGKVISGSSYRTLGRQCMYQRVDSTNPVMRPLLDFAQSMVDLFQPDVAFVLDVAEVDGDYKVVEVNTINSAGFYATDMRAVVAALENLYA